MTTARRFGIGNHSHASIFCRNFSSGCYCSRPPASPTPAPAIDAKNGRLAYLFSRYPYVSQTFCDSEMLGLEARGWDLVAGSLYPPEDSFRHEQLLNLEAPIFYPPPPAALRVLEKEARDSGIWPEEMLARHEREYGPSFQSEVRCRNALYFAEQFQRIGVSHVHVHFANRATHTALFLKEIAGITFSFTTHGQDFMVDLGSDVLLREMCDSAEFVVAVCEYSRELLARKCPASAEKIIRIYNGLNPDGFETVRPEWPRGNLRLVSVGRLIEFKGFHRLIGAVAKARAEGVDVTLRIIGEGPWESQLRDLARKLRLDGEPVEFLGRLMLEQVTAELQTADAFALGCVVDRKGASDLLPTVITEAMLSGMPVVSTRVAGVPEMIVNGKTGYLADENDEEGLAEAFAKLAAHPRRAQKLGEAGRQRALELFTLDVTVPQLAAQFAKCVDETDREPSDPPKGVALFDLSLPDRMNWLLAELPVLKEHGFRIIAAAGKVEPGVLEKLGGAINEIEWLPDGMVLEMEWRAREAWRIQLEMLRTEKLSTAVDGEIYLRAARRGCWLAAHAAKLAGDGRLEHFYAPGIEESLAVWLAAKLEKVPLALAFETDRRWNGELLRKLAKDAGRVSDASGKVSKEEGADALLHGTPPPPRRRIGPINWKVPVEPPTAETRQARLKQWLKQDASDE